MPNQDKTGPRGEGQRTGRGLGNCPPSKKSNNQSYNFGRRFMGVGRRFFKGFRKGFGRKGA